jgi:hypothetical protein
VVARTHAASPTARSLRDENRRHGCAAPDGRFPRWPSPSSTRHRSARIMGQRQAIWSYSTAARSSSTPRSSWTLVGHRSAAASLHQWCRRLVPTRIRDAADGAVWPQSARLVLARPRVRISALETPPSAPRETDHAPLLRRGPLAAQPDLLALGHPPWSLQLVELPPPPGWQRSWPARRRPLPERRRPSPPWRRTLPPQRLPPRPQRHQLPERRPTPLRARPPNHAQPNASRRAVQTRTRDVRPYPSTRLTPPSRGSRPVRYLWARPASSGASWSPPACLEHRALRAPRPVSSAIHSIWLCRSGVSRTLRCVVCTTPDTRSLGIRHERNQGHGWA